MTQASVSKAHASCRAKGVQGTHRHRLLQLVEEALELLHVIARVEGLVAEVVSKAGESVRNLRVAT